MWIPGDASLFEDPLPQSSAAIALSENPWAVLLPKSLFVPHAILPFQALLSLEQNQLLSQVGKPLYNPVSTTLMLSSPPNSPPPNFTSAPRISRLFLEHALLFLATISLFSLSGNIILQIQASCTCC